jgi:hypothetical protein
VPANHNDPLTIAYIIDGLVRCSDDLHEGMTVRAFSDRIAPLYRAIDLNPTQVGKALSVIEAQHRGHNGAPRLIRITRTAAGKRVFLLPGEAVWNDLVSLRDAGITGSASVAA